MNPTFWILGGVGLALIFFFTGCTSVGKPMRTNPASGAAAADSWYIQSKPTNGARPFSCSFVEFDGRGDYIDFQQHQDAWRKVQQFTNENLLLVIYCHGWKNNSQSADVVRFNSFLGRLAASPEITNKGFRVHGLYLAWRGNLVHPAVDKNDEDGFYAQTVREFGEPIVNDKHHRKLPLIPWAIEQLSYWSRKGAAEFQVSGSPIARTVFTCASLAKEMGRTNGVDRNRVFVMGHSLGALMLEKSLGQACLGVLAEEWPWFTGQTSANYRANPLPFDVVLSVNSAAPAIYAKEMRDFLAAHRGALTAARVPHADAPVFISVTSDADWATGVVHPIGNMFSRFYPSLQRWYTTNLLATAHTNDPQPAVHQSAFYKRTPGHHPLLVDHWVQNQRTLDPSEASDPASVLRHNLDFSVEKDQARVFQTSPRGKKGKPHEWLVTDTPPTRKAEKWTRQFHDLPPRRYPSDYWIIRCDKGLIRGHGDVWSTTTMEMYAALYRLAEVERRR
jgi:hypothetical protein